MKREKNKDYGLIDWKTVLEYDEDSPSCLRWKSSNKNAGTLCHGYFKIKYKGKQWYAHRVVWIVCKGVFDKDLLIDHFDGIKTNNKINNLRLATHSSNGRNVKKIAKAKYPVYGICKTKRTLSNGSVYEYYKITIIDNSGKRVEKLFNITKLGDSVSLELAVQWRLSKELEFGTYTKQHGKEVA